MDFDALNDTLHDFADAVADDGQAPITFIWEVPAVFRARPFLRCDLRKSCRTPSATPADNLAVTAVCL